MASTLLARASKISKCISFTQVKHRTISSLEATPNKLSRFLGLKTIRVSLVVDKITRSLCGDSIPAITEMNTKEQVATSCGSTTNSRVNNSTAFQCIAPLKKTTTVNQSYTQVAPTNPSVKSKPSQIRKTTVAWEPTAKPEVTKKAPNTLKS